MKNIRNSLILLILLILSNTCFTQNYWTGLNGPFGGNVIDIKKHSNGNIYIIRNEAAYFSNDNGLTWIEFDNATLGSNLTMDFSPSGVIYLGKSSAGVWWSANGGQSWNYNPIHVAPHSGQWASVITLAISPTGVVYANNYRSFNGGTSFTQFNIAPGAFAYSYVFNPSGHVFAGTSNGVYRSNDNGNSWSNISGDLQSSGIYSILYENENSILVSITNEGVFRTTNSGSNWTQINNGLTDLNVGKLYQNEGEVFVATATGKLFVSSDSGNNWSLVSDNPDAGKINSVHNNGDDIFIGTAFAGVQFSDDNGLNWEDRNQGLNLITLNDLTFGPDEIFAASFNGVFYSPDNGNSWTKRNNGLPSYFINTIFNNAGGKLFAGVQNSGIYASTDKGNSWSESKTGLHTQGIFSYIKESGGFLFALRSSSFDSIALYRSPDEGVNWQNVFSTTGFFFDNITIDSEGKIYIAGFDPMFNPVLFSSTDNGDNWSELNIGMLQVTFNNFTSAGTKLYMTGSWNVMMSTNSGVDWIDLDNGDWGTAQPGRMNVNSNGDIFLAINSSIYLTTDDGASWTEINTGLPTGSNVRKFVFDDAGFLYCTTHNNGIFRTLGSTITGIEISGNEIPAGFILYQNYPNPFASTTKIQFNIKKAGFVTLKVYDMTGREVATVVNEKLSPGIHSVDFDASGFSGGVLFYELRSADFREIKRMITFR